MCLFVFFFFKQKTAYEMRISDWSSDVCSSDLAIIDGGHAYNQRPIDLTRRTAGKALCEESRRARRAGQHQRSGRVLVQPVNQLGPSLSVDDQCVQQEIGRAHV